MIVEDSPSDAGLMVRQLQQGGFETIYERVDNAEQMRAALEKQNWEIVLSDFSLQGFDAYDALAVLREHNPDIPFIVVSGKIAEEVAIALMRDGASDYLMKNNLERLAAAVKRELENASTRQARRIAETAQHESERQFRQLFDLAPVPLCYVKNDGSFLDFNKRFEQTFGYNHTDLPTLNEWWPLAYPDPEYQRRALETWNAAVREALDKRIDIQPIEYRITCKNGDTLTILITGIAVGNNFLATFFDITERKQTEAELKRNLMEAERARQALLGVLEDQRESQAALRESEVRYRLMFSANPVPMWVYDLKTLAFIAVNDAAVTHYGYTREEFLGMTIADIRLPEDVPTLKEKIRHEAEQVDFYSHSGNWRHRKKDGSLIWAEISGHTLYFEGRYARIILAHDVTARIAAEEQLNLNARVFESSWEGVMITDAKNTIVSVNKAFTEITGYTPEETIGKNPHLLSAEKQDNFFYQTMWQDILNKDHWEGEILNRRKNGDVYPQRLSISCVRDQNGLIANYIGILSDLTQHKAAEERILFLSNFDPLTQLPNRELLRDRAQLVLATAKRAEGKVALMYLDLDRFKIVNDSLGPSIGDQLLKEMSNRLAGHLQLYDTLCRQGGDEFILLLPNTDAEAAAHIARKMLNVIAQPFTIDSQCLTMTASIGIAEFPQDGESFEQLAQSADAALFRAKANGRNNFQFFTRQMHLQAYETLQTENELRTALQQDELLLYYQPQVDAKTSKIIGAEALIRWQHPKKGMMSPARFIPIAEESGLIGEIGDWVLNTAVRQAADWQNAGLAIVPVAVNLSAMQFRQDTLYQTVAQTLRKCELDPGMLELEMTEGVAMENYEHTISLLDRLHKLGVAFSLDDFGTGYSSLSYLKRFRIDKLKIDQSFVHDLGRDPDDAAIVTAIINMAKSLGFKTIAEGVETREQLDFLREKQCDEIQGYFFSKPVPAEEFAKLLANGGDLSEKTAIPEVS
ncbi:MAG: EAL domain-containing protein [Candidatus Binatia bacterium]